jgi:acetyltransferase-like isoleucine patch superfamily enzyme
MNQTVKSLLRPAYRCFRVAVCVRWLKTLRVNFALLPFRQALLLPIVVVSRLKINSLKGRVVFQNAATLRFGQVQIGRDMDNMPISGVPARLHVDGELTFEGRAIVCPGAQLVVWRGAGCFIGEQVMLMSGSTLKSTLHVSVGRYTRIASGCFVMDSNIHLVKDIETGRVNRVSGAISIGRYCWVTMNASITAGAVVPDFSIVGRGSLVNKDFSGEGEGLFLAGSPAKVVAGNRQRIFDSHIEEEATRYFAAHPDAEYFQLAPGFETPEHIESYFSVYTI